MILIIKTNSEKLHDLEFARPIENILKDKNVDFKSVNFLEFEIQDLESADKIIICGTSLKDDEYLSYLDKFLWLKETKKPVLGICSGMQIISLIFGGKLRLKKGQEIGITIQDFEKNFLNVFENDDTQMAVYHLHNNHTTLPKDFEKFTDSKIPQAIKHKTKPIYGVLFHPEVRNKKLIEEFLKL